MEPLTPWPRVTDTLQAEFDTLLELYRGCFAHHAGVAENNGGYIRKGAIESMQSIINHMNKIVTPCPSDQKTKDPSRHAR